MSFLNNNNSEFLSARITQKGRNAISKGNFNISYFQIGDSEFDYTTPFSGFTGLGGAPYQKVMSPFDKESGIKYPYQIDSTTGSTSYGNPIENSSINTLRNVMGPAGYISNYEPYVAVPCTGTTIECPTEAILTSSINGNSYITVPTGGTFSNCQYITLAFGNQFGGTDPNVPIVTGNSNSLIYRIVSVSGNTINFDRNTPNLSSYSGYTQVICNSCENEFPNETSISPACLPEPIDTTQQLNSWTLNTIWGDKPIGFDVNGMDENLTGFTSNVYISTKELLGYTTSSGQTYSDLTGGTVNHPISYTNSFGDNIDVSSEEQRVIAIIHFSQLGDIKNDPERFFKYDDYISSDTSLTDSIIMDNGYPISDSEYFEVYIPFINYHRNTGTTIGATFSMGSTDYYIKSTVNPTHRLLFRFLIDEQGNNVGKVFPNNKIIVFDDQELVAILDYKSNRKYTLPAPKVTLVNSDLTTNALLTSTGQTLWVTYMFSYTGDTQLNGLPCNYFSKVSGTTTPSQITVKFNNNSFNSMTTSVNTGFIANKFLVLLQEVDTGDLPRHDSWYSIDLTSSIPNHTVGNLINPTNMSNYTFTLTNPQFTGGTLFDLSDYLGTIPSEPSTLPQFGDEQPFPGSVSVVRATDIQEMNFLVNLPSSQFTQTQNPTYTLGEDKKITEVALLDSNKEVLVIAKTATPITRIGTQVFAVKLDF